MAEACSVPESVLAELFSLSASPRVELPRLLDAVLDFALELTGSDAGGAIWLRNPDDHGKCHLRAVGGTSRYSQSSLTRRLADPHLSPSGDPPHLSPSGRTSKGRKRNVDHATPELDEEPCYCYCRDTSELPGCCSLFHESRSLFHESRSLVFLPRLGAEPASVMLQVEARRARAYSEKDLHLLASLHRAANVLAERHLLKEHAFAAGFDIHPVGMSQEFLQLESLIKRVASDPSSPVLIRGERGSGKELVAYAIHYFSARRDQSFVPVNSAAFTDGLAADELFGHRKGAYTGAELVRDGLLRSAHKGSLFLDEIGDMPPGVQASLLRVLDHGEVRQIGVDKSHRIDVRVIAASNRSFEQLMEKGDFRRDLYDRLNVLQIRVPPLRERKDDLKLLADFFLKKACLNSGRHLRPGDRNGCSWCLGSGGETCAQPTFYDALAGHDFPGNVRELRNKMLRLAAIVPDQELTSAHLRFVTAKRNGGTPPAPDPKLESIIRNHIRHVLEESGGNKSAAARTLGLPLTTMINKMKKLGIAS